MVRAPAPDGDGGIGIAWSRRAPDAHRTLRNDPAGMGIRTGRHGASGFPEVRTDAAGATG